MVCHWDGDASMVKNCTSHPIPVPEPTPLQSASSSEETDLETDYDMDTRRKSRMPGLQMLGRVQAGLKLRCG
ncbi:hypothetical protein E2C01_002923 [Portunus trituberculatus]|uniref:Uncharacterized protein n=1 Tax=Portunus trituberculatus TaxID=210409 RepID=A0A5B7CLJ7_PORTR|nr:hypothetical protein [Portunus trituberculatus]